MLKSEVLVLKWENVREKYPNKWVLIEAIEAVSIDGERILNKISVLNYFDTSEAAMHEYRIEHRVNPNRELYVYHTQNTEIQIKERLWMGVRSR